MDNGRIWTSSFCHVHVSLDGTAPITSDTAERSVFTDATPYTCLWTSQVSSRETIVPNFLACYRFGKQWKLTKSLQMVGLSHVHAILVSKKCIKLELHIIKTLVKWRIQFKNKWFWHFDGNVLCFLWSVLIVRMPSGFKVVLRRGTIKCHSSAENATTRILLSPQAKRVSF